MKRKCNIMALFCLRTLIGAMMQAGIFAFVFTLSCAEPENGSQKEGISIQPPAAANANQSAFISQPKPVKSARNINSIFQDKSGNYWFGTNGEGVFRFDGASATQFRQQDGLCDDQILSIKEDRSGLIWVGTIGGISRFDGKVFKKVVVYDMPNQQLSARFVSGPYDLWFEAGGGAYWYNHKSFSYLLLPASEGDARHINPTNPKQPDPRKLNPYSVYCLLKDRKGNIWFGTQTLGVCRFDGKTFTWFTGKGLAGPAVRGIFEDRNGTLWFGNNGNGLFSFDGKSLTNFTHEKKLDNPEFLKSGKSVPGTLARVWAINEDNTGNLWIATCDCGVWRYDGTSLVNYTTADGLTSNAVNTIFKDRSGDLWFGTDGAGVCRHDGRVFSAVSIDH